MTEKTNETPSLDELLAATQIEENPTAAESINTDNNPDFTDEENKEFNAFADESILSIKDKEQRAAEDAPKEPNYLDHDTAAMFAQKAIGFYCLEVSKKTGYEFELGPIMQQIAEFGLTPLMMKYGGQINDLMTNAGNAIDLDSKTPELLAAGSLVAIAVPTHKHIKTVAELQTSTTQEQTPLKTKTPTETEKAA